MPKLNSVADLEKYRSDILAKRAAKKTILVSVCSGTGCTALGSQKVIDAFKAEMKKRNMEDKLDIKPTGCRGFCQNGPVVVILPEAINYHLVKPEDVPEIIDKTILNNQLVEKLLLKDMKSDKKCAHEKDIAFYQGQNRLLLGDNVKTDPLDIEDYIANGGFIALAKALFKMKPQEILDEVTKANLRGRGGGGFPTGRKWATTIKAHETPKYVIINCDEGDPGAFMNRSLMEGNPNLVFEGLIIGGYTIGSNQGFIYVRDEYPIAVKNSKNAIKQMHELGLLGKNILGSGFDFDIDVHKGAGAFICGESTALMASIEGHVGEPRPKYIHTAEKGLWNKPTVLNNVETWANIPYIVNKGSEWFKTIGTANSKGTKILSLVGKVVNTGLVEVPLGTSLRKIIYDIGGGIKDGKKFKAVQTGGPSGGCIPEEHLDAACDFDELIKLGSMMGSGGIIVMDEDTCMVEISRYFTKFLSEESCGKCIPCREGLRQMLQLLTDLTEGKAKPGTIELLEELSGVVKDASLCALGQSAPNPVLTTLRYFRSEYEAHMKGECPAKICKKMFEYYIVPEKCKACGICKRECPTQAISGEKKVVHIIDQKKCIKCGICYNSCPYDSIEKFKKAPEAKKA